MLVSFQLLCISAFSQTTSDSDTLGLPGDNLDLYAVLDLFQNSKTIEEFEKLLNLEKTAINNLDLNLDTKVDFIKVVTKQNGDDFTFILQVDVSEKETQDVAVIIVSKDKDKKVSLQIIGDKELYGKDYIVEPQPKTTPAVTANPGYEGTDTVVVSAPAKTTVVVVESAPIVQYVYSPVYVPYYPPYHYAYYPPYFAAFTVMAVGIYCHNNYYHGYPYHGHGNTVVVHNHNTYNNYNNNYRNTSNTVNHNNKSGNYNNNRNNVSNTSNNRNNVSNNNKAGVNNNKATTNNSNKASTGVNNNKATTSNRSSSFNKPTTSNNRTSTSSRPSTSSRSSGSFGGGRSSGGGRRGGGGGRR